MQFSCCSFGRNGRAIAGGLGNGPDRRTIYQSFLVDFGNQGTDDPTAFGKKGYEMWNGGVGDSFLAVDLFVNHFSGVNELTLKVRTPSTGLLGQSQLVGGGLTLDELSVKGTHLVVFKFEFNPAVGLNNPTDDDRVTVYLDVTDSTESNWVPAAQIDVAASDLVITHHGGLANFTFSGGGHCPGKFDEVRWGDTFADVTPFQGANGNPGNTACNVNPPTVPVPGSLSLLALGVVGLTLARRRKA